MNRLNLRTASMMVAGVLGVFAAGSAAQAKVYLGVEVVENDYRGGMQIVSVVEGGPAFLDGNLRPLDLITAINGAPVQSPLDMENALSVLNPGDTVQLDVQDRFGTPFSVNLTTGGGPVVMFALTGPGGKPGAPGKGKVKPPLVRPVHPVRP